MKLKCEKCGNLNEADAVICHFCGERLYEPDISIKDGFYKLPVFSLLILGSLTIIIHILSTILSLILLNG